ncbi:MULTISPECIES: cellulase family glycosylhydrolase [Paenibacillus]|uniref:cellulase family glycosylhydrolase n=1 Tax=Paenibacillus TaxID=44249 RepID=UPI0022B8A8F2|nr:cellulase family glycosylhydrolase [Paenibacillus caseinilyticus]MCZ8519426.1 cellulase family glycosylhydrolase [Paenibacillus caseinilyticus]
MKSYPKMMLVFAMIFTLLLSNVSGRAQAADSGRIVDQHGQLKVVGSQLTNQSGAAVQLKGMSSHGLQWFGQYVNKDSIQWLRDNWGITVFRAAMYTGENGYISNPEGSKAKVKEAVQAAVDLGIYVIIDWHILSDGDPNTYKAQSKTFFQEMAKLYGKYPNVIYEIANEPNGNVNWNSQIKPYAEEITAAIRAIDPDNIIIVGTGTWSQDVHDAAANPLKAGNVMYAVHFYAGTHGQWLRDRITNAMNSGVAVFVTEWGTSDASGNGGPFLTQSKEWTDFLASKKVSWVNWSLADKSESSAALLPGAGSKGGWPDSQLSASGKFVREQIRSGNNNNGGTPTPTPTVPAVPTGLTATAGNASVSLSWNAVNGAASYHVKRAASAKGPFTVVASNVKGTSYTNSGLTNNTTYYYVVSAVNSKGQSSDSAKVSATPKAGSSSPSGVVVQYRAGDSNAADNQMRPLLKIVNKGSQAIPLSEYKIRYYYTNDGKSQQIFCDYASVDCKNLTLSSVPMSKAKTNANAYIELGFKAGAGQVASKGETGEIQIRIHNQDWSNVNEANDYSFDGSKTSSIDWNRVTLYRNGTLVWGTEP